jgi:hypothetical protein
MPINFRFDKLTIADFRGIRDLEISLADGCPLHLIGSNNAGRSARRSRFEDQIPTSLPNCCPRERMDCALGRLQISVAPSRERSRFPSLRGATRRSNPVRAGRLDCFASLAMTAKNPQGKFRVTGASTLVPGWATPRTWPSSLSPQHITVPAGSVPGLNCGLMTAQVW